MVRKSLALAAKSGKTSPGTKKASAAARREQAWIPVGVEPPTLTALRTLLHHPQLAKKVEDAGHFAAEDQTNNQLLIALVEAVQKNLS